MHYRPEVLLLSLVVGCTVTGAVVWAAHRSKESVGTQYHRGSVMVRFEKSDDVLKGRFRDYVTYVTRSVPLGEGPAEGLTGSCDVRIESIVSDPGRGFYGIDTVSVDCESLARYFSGDSRHLSGTAGSKGELVSLLRDFVDKIEDEGKKYQEKHG